MHFQAVLTVCISFHTLVFTVKTYCVLLILWYIVFIHNTPNGRNYYNAHSSIILTAYFTTLMLFNFLNAILGFSVTLS